MATTTTTQPAILPPQLWHQVLRNLNEENDLTELWMSHRHVNTVFRDAVESIFKARHLRKTYINFNLGETHSEEIGRIVLNMEYSFTRLSEDQSNAIFDADPGEDEYHSELRSALMKISTSPDNFMLIEEPQHTVQIHHDLNDTPIPGLSIDLDTFQLTCDWRGLYTRFFGEEELYHILTAKWTEDNSKWAEEMSAKTARGEMDMMSAIQKAIEAFAEASDENRKKARRARISRQSQRTGSTTKYDDIVNKSAEKAALEKLKQARQLASMVEDSEFDDGEYDEEGDDEEDEWEDASDEDDDDEILGEDESDS
ncbi:hypothetical protein BGZ60DRAFT_535555 [Tricladium varicosporioides]|nr:hypothetical protein BGZ60DRAFT_535555 [Hymenoscyphus varicosporioides]